jgi:hypothetical protein
LSRTTVALPISLLILPSSKERPFTPGRFCSGTWPVLCRPFTLEEATMAYDRYDTRNERSRWSNDRNDERSEGRRYARDDRDYERGSRDDRGFFERAGDEIASWFGDDEAERRRHQDQMRDERYGGAREREWERGEGRGYATSERDYNPSWRREWVGSGDRGPNWDERGSRSFSDRQRGYRPMTGDYGRSEDFSRRNRGEDEGSQSQWGRDPYRSTSRAGSSDRSDRFRHEDPHYHSWRQRQIDELDRDYDDYRRENQSRFESDFGSWREQRMQKRGLLGQIREHMEVVGSDDEHVGTVDRTAGDRIILTKSDAESGGAHHSLSCSDIDRIEGDRVILACPADQARQRWRDESRGRALFEREDQGEMGPRALDRSFEGTYR